MPGLQHETVIEIVFAVDRNYLDPAVVAAWSVVNARCQSWVPRFHILDCGIGEPLHDIQHAFEPLGGCSVHRPDRTMALAGGRDRIAHFSSAALGRLQLGCLPSDVKRVLYLDADVLVREDLATLYETDLGGNTVGAVLHPYPERRAEVVDGAFLRLSTGASPPGYFNSGVLLVDLALWRADAITERAMILYERFGEQIGTGLDQDVLNCLFSGGWTALDPRWNKPIDRHPVGLFGEGRMAYLMEASGIIHYVGRIKPWHDGFPRANPLWTLYDRHRRAADRGTWSSPVR